jgi:hypothetical protein
MVNTSSNLAAAIILPTSSSSSSCGDSAKSLNSVDCGLHVHSIWSLYKLYKNFM